VVFQPILVISLHYKEILQALIQYFLPAVLTFLASVQFTPPYSLFNESIEAENSYRHPEYHKWRFNAEWYVPLGKPMGAEKNRQFIIKIAGEVRVHGQVQSQS
jgi:hypothetical protein